jgi:hypothetical protein
MIKFQNLAISVAVLCVAGCASTPESVTTEHKGKVTIIHHRRKTNSGLVDKIEAIDARGAVTQAEVHVYDVGRYIDGSGNIHEAHSVYRTVQSARPNLALPAKVSGGPRTVYTPPNYVPPPKDQRINDAIAEANAAKEKLQAAAKQIQDRLKEDNALRGQLQTEIDENQRLQDQINAGFNTPQHQATPPATAAQNAAQADVDALKQWGEQVQQ